MRAPMLAAAVLALVACGGDSTGPNTSDVSGTWMYNATNLNGAGLSCSITNVTFSLTQTGSSFTGSTSGGTLSCTFAGESDSESLGNSTVANGQVDGTAIQFDIGSSDLHNAGTRDGKSITGTLTANVEVDTTAVVLSGTFSLVKQ
jgi:hypothetical protein